MCVMGWPIQSEILTRQKRHVGLDTDWLGWSLAKAKAVERKFPLMPGLCEVLELQAERRRCSNRKAIRSFRGCFIRTENGFLVSARTGPRRAMRPASLASFPIISDAPRCATSNARAFLALYSDGGPLHGINISPVWRQTLTKPWAVRPSRPMPAAEYG